MQIKFTTRKCQRRLMVQPPLIFHCIVHSLKSCSRHIYLVSKCTALVLHSLLHTPAPIRRSLKANQTYFLTVVASESKVVIAAALSECHTS